MNQDESDITSFLFLVSQGFRGRGKVKGNLFSSLLANRNAKCQGAILGTNSRLFCQSLPGTLVGFAADEDNEGAELCQWDETVLISREAAFTSLVRSTPVTKSNECQVPSSLEVLLETQLGHRPSWKMQQEENQQQQMENQKRGHVLLREIHGTQLEQKAWLGTESGVAECLHHQPLGLQAVLLVTLRTATKAEEGPLSKEQMKWLFLYPEG